MQKMQSKGKNPYGQTIYNRFSSRDPTIQFLMGQKGQSSLDRQIVKMMKDMSGAQIIEFADQFFKLGQNQCQSLKNLIGNQLTSRINIQSGSGNRTIVATNSLNNDKRKQQEFSLFQSLSFLNDNNQSKFTSLFKNHNDQIEAICQQNHNQKQSQDIDFERVGHDEYIPKIKNDCEYLERADDQNIEEEDHQNIHFQSEFPTTIQENQQQDFEEVQRIQLPQNKFKITYNNGDSYQGQMQNDMKNGWGDYFYSTGEKYSGLFQDDQIQGYGRYFFLSGAEYQGDWSSGMKHGMGILRFVNQDVYEGAFVNDLFHGKGIYKYATGDIFQGMWKNGIKHGKGKFQGIDGSLKIGFWVEDKFQI